MSLFELEQKILNRSARLAVIGLGYVGLPVACEFASAGYDVIGIDILSKRVSQINEGVSPIQLTEPELADLLANAVRSGKLRASSDYSALADRDMILIDVETPVDEQNIPQYSALKASLLSLGPVMKPGALVIVESTLAPGTMTNVVLPILTESSAPSVGGMSPAAQLTSEFYIGHCPERVMPGKLLNNLRSMSRVAGGMTPQTADVMVTLYQQIVKADVDAVDCLTAELVKTVENAYRDVQIAFANEVALICEATGGDVWQVRHLVNKSPHRQMHLPGAGVGGHCIPKDPWLLAYSVHDRNIPLRLIPAARVINDSMPLHIVELLMDALGKYRQTVFCTVDESSPQKPERSLAGIRILVMGYTYLEDSDDTRNSPSRSLILHLQKSGARAIIHDPHVPAYQGDVLEMARTCDAAVVMVRHAEYIQLDPQLLAQALRAPVIIDGRAVYYSARPERDGSILRIIGKAAY